MTRAERHLQPEAHRGCWRSIYYWGLGQWWSTVAFTALYSEMERFSASKMFILISTVMTWALTKPPDPVSGHVSSSLTLFRYSMLCRRQEQFQKVLIVLIPHNKKERGWFRSTSVAHEKQDTGETYEGDQSSARGQDTDNWIKCVCMYGSNLDCWRMFYTKRMIFRCDLYPVRVYRCSDELL